MVAPVPTPLFAPAELSANAQAAVAMRGTPATLNLDDIFGDVMFTPEGDTVFLGEHQQPHQQQDTTGNRANHIGGQMLSADQSSMHQAQQHLMNQPQNLGVQMSGEGDNVKIVASKMKLNGQFIAVSAGGGLETTQLQDPTKPALVMGTAPTQVVPTTQAVPFKKSPQERRHLQYAVPKSQSSTPGANIFNSKRGKKGGRGSDRKMSEQQRVERRERNREHAKRSRIRKKFLLESLQQSVSLLKEENDKLKESIRTHLGGERGNKLIEERIAGIHDSDESGNLIAATHGQANKVLDDPDFSFIKALQTAQQNFVVTDPSLPDNPIVYASQGFLNLTGYTLDQILGRNCRFLQGPETDPKAVERIRNAIEQGTDMSVCLLNYRVDGTTFWNQFFIAALRDASGNVTNFVGVQCKVSDHYAATVTKHQQEEDDASVTMQQQATDATSQPQMANHAMPTLDPNQMGNTA